MMPVEGSRPIAFQSSLELSPECNVTAPSAILGVVTVSILTRAFARVQRPDCVAWAGEYVSILTRAFARVQPAP